MLSEENNMTVINNIAINSTTDKQILMYHSYTKIIIWYLDPTRMINILAYEIYDYYYQVIIF